MLFGLAQQGNAPKALLNVDKRGVPVSSILVSAVVTALCVLLNYLAPESAFGLLMALVVSALVINWAMISLAHMMFRRAKQQQGVKTRFPALFYPFGNVLCLLFMAAVLIIMLMTPGMAISVWLIPVWLLILGVGYLCKEKNGKNGESPLIVALLFRPPRPGRVLSASQFPTYNHFIHISGVILLRKKKARRRIITAII